ncbi:MAG TPA: hypothetical protein VNE42_12010 [Acidimicrobiales bacterium]|nr:hypothetical protein [Acidimicrobiales bacterium]
MKSERVPSEEVSGRESEQLREDTDEVTIIEIGAVAVAASDAHALEQAQIQSRVQPETVYVGPASSPPPSRRLVHKGAVSRRERLRRARRDDSG